MTKYLIIFLFPFLLKSQNDKALHFYCGIGISIGITEIFYNSFDKPYRLIPISISGGCLAGYTKELYDSRPKGSGFNKEDLSVTSWGVLCSVPINSYIITRKIRIENANYLKLHGKL